MLNIYIGYQIKNEISLFMFTLHCKSRDLVRKLWSENCKWKTLFGLIWLETWIENVGQEPLVYNLIGKVRSENLGQNM